MPSLVSSPSLQQAICWDLHIPLLPSPVDHIDFLTPNFFHSLNYFTQDSKSFSHSGQWNIVTSSYHVQSNILILIPVANLLLISLLTVWTHFQGTKQFLMQQTISFLLGIPSMPYFRPICIFTCKLPRPRNCHCPHLQESLENFLPGNT